MKIKFLEFLSFGFDVFVDVCGIKSLKMSKNLHFFKILKKFNVN